MKFSQKLPITHLTRGGIGKTYLAAFDSAKYKRVLFVAHREEILKQAVVSFKNVRNSADYGFFDGKEKDRDKSVIFASVATLGRTEYLNETYFPADYFEYVIIDEFHHAVTDQYRRIVEYFQPQFLLGLTATPERMDGKNIYEICDYNVPYQISLKEAINKGMLVPFHYYGVYDETDYSGLRIVKGRYDEQELNQAYIGNERRYDLIYKYYRKYRSLRAIGFCCSRQHAEDMAKEFCQRGIASAAVYSGENGAYAEERNEAIRKLKNGEIRVIFSVDMFNEGMDIASLDMVMFLRPTESPVVFLQQLGRGLRLYKGKEYLNVLDFIGNYEKAGKAPLLLSGEQSFNKKGSCEYQDLEYPDDCIVDFDMRLIDLFKEIDKKKLTLKMQIQKEYYRVKGLLDGKRPSRMDLFTYMDDDIYRCCVSGSHAKGNPFQHYLDFLYELGELSADEQELYAGIGREFIQTIETTEMQKVYTMPILYSFYNQGNIRLAVTDEEVLESWKEFFDTGTKWKDFPNVNTYEDYKKVTDKQHLSKAKRMPIRFLKASGKGFFVEKDGYALALRNEIGEVVGNMAFGEQMLHLFVYEIPEEEEGDPKLRLSNLSRLIPSDFYGNRVSVKPEYLFKPWKQQYQKYNQNSNDALMKYHTSLEYKYEVTLDLENFFPTINPIIIYRYIINHLPAYLNDEERKMMKRVLQKLLFCKLTTTFDEKTAGQYYKVTKGAGNYDNVDKIEQNEKECWAFKEKSDKFVRGIPQGLPQSYFLGNIYMISIAEIFRKKFTGVSYFYVDDSVIFTNDVREDNFKEQLKELNKQIADEANNFEEDSAIYPEGTEKFYKSDLYGVNVHLDGKSNYTRLDNLDDSEVYLKCISREMSQAGSDFFRMYSDEENRNLEEKLDVLSKQVKAKRDQLVEEKSQKRDSGNEDAIEKDEDDTQKFEKRLTRYYRFFEYRKQRLVAMHQPENGSDEDYKKELEKIIYSELSEEDMEDDEKILQAFMNSYGADIWDAAIGMYQTFADDKEQNVLKNYILKINELCYGKASVEFSYLECTYRDLLRNEEENDYSVEEDIFEETLKRYMTEEDLRDIYNDPYKTLKYLARVRLKRYANKHYEVAEDYSSKLLKKTDEEILKILLSENEKLPSRLRIVCASTQKIIRMVLNTVCSYLFNVEVSNHPVLAQNSKKALTYGELRILSFVRNSLFTIR